MADKDSDWLSLADKPFQGGRLRLLRLLVVCLWSLLTSMQSETMYFAGKGVADALWIHTSGFLRLVWAWLLHVQSGRSLWYSA